MTTLTSLILDAADPSAAASFYDALGLGDRIRTRRAASSSPGFRSFTLSVVVSGPGTVDAMLDDAIAAGASELKPRTKSIWGYGGTLRAPDGAIWKIATSAKRDTARVDRRIDAVVVLLGVEDVPASKRFYMEHGFTVARSFGRSYAEFTGDPSGIKLALYRRRSLAKDAGVPADPARPAGMVLRTDVGAFTDPDGFSWSAETTGAAVGPTPSR